MGSSTVAFDATGAPQATQLYGPYGAVRYSSGVMPGSYGFTGQHADTVTGLDDYGARYYDPVAGQFTSADTTLAGGLNRYAYVGGNPETNTDPSGHMTPSQASDYNPQLAYYQWCAQPHTYYGSVGAFAKDSGQFFLGTDTLSQSYHTLFQDPQASTSDKVKAAVAVGVTAVNDVVAIGSLFIGDPEVGEGVEALDGGLLATDEAADVAATATDAATTTASDVATSDAGNVVRYRGTTVASASDVVDNQAIDVERIQHFQANYTPARGPGVYFTSQPPTAAYYADLAGGSGRGMGPAVISMEVAPEDWSGFVQKWGIEDNVPIIGGKPGQVETVIPFEAVSELENIATFSWAP